MFIDYATEKPHKLRRSGMEGISSRLSKNARQMPPRWGLRILRGIGVL